MQRVGTNEAGFSVEFDQKTRTLHVVTWSFWSIQTAQAFSQTVIDACRGAGPPLCLVIDAVELKPLRDEGQAAFATLMQALPELGVTKVQVIVDSHLTKMQLLRLVRLHAVHNLVQFGSTAQKTA